MRVTLEWTVLLIKLIIFPPQTFDALLFSVRFTLKFYFILQISFWVHCFPELYFTRAKRVRISYVWPRICDRGCEIYCQLYERKEFYGEQDSDFVLNCEIYRLIVPLLSVVFDRRRFFQRFSYTLNICFSSGLPTC